MMGPRHTRGASALMAVMLLGALAGGALLLWHQNDAVDRRRAAARDDGRLLAMWLKAAHDATMTADYRPALAADPDGFPLAPAALPGAPPGLPAPAGLTLGVMDDGAGVPMAWAVLRVDDSRRGAARIGALDGGLAAVGIGGETGGPMSAREAAVGVARGAAVPGGSLFATADRGLPYQEEALYRRQQPGRPWASRMEVGLVMDRNDIAGGGTFEGREARVTDDAEAGCVPVPPATSCVAADVAGRADAGTMSVDDLDAAAVDGQDDLRVTGALHAGSMELAGSGGLAVNGSPGGVRASGRIEAGSLRTIGPVRADLLVVGGAVSGVTRLSVTEGGIVAREMTVGNGLTSAGAADARTLAAGSLNAGSVGAGSIALGGDVFGPSARITGTLTVGSCDGC